MMTTGIPALDQHLPYGIEPGIILVTTRHGQTKEHAHALCSRITDKNRTLAARLDDFNWQELNIYPDVNTLIIDATAIKLKMLRIIAFLCELARQRQMPIFIIDTRPRYSAPGNARYNIDLDANIVLDIEQINPTTIALTIAKNRDALRARILIPITDLEPNMTLLSNPPNPSPSVPSVVESPTKEPAP